MRAWGAVLASLARRGVHGVSLALKLQRVRSATLRSKIFWFAASDVVFEAVENSSLKKGLVPSSAEHDK